MRRRQREEPEIFGMSLMDTVSCGIGASIVMMLVFVSMVQPSADVESSCIDCSSSTQMLSRPEKPIFTAHIELSNIKNEDFSWGPEDSTKKLLSGQLRFSHTNYTDNSKVSALNSVDAVSHRLYAELIEPQGRQPWNEEIAFSLEFEPKDVDKKTEALVYFVRETRAHQCKIPLDESPKRVVFYRLFESNTYEIDNCEALL